VDIQQYAAIRIRTASRAAEDVDFQRDTVRDARVRQAAAAATDSGVTTRVVLEDKRRSIRATAAHVLINERRLERADVLRKAEPNGAVFTARAVGGRE